MKRLESIGVYEVQFMRLSNCYCYNTKCPARTTLEPWPRSDGQYKLIEVTSKKGTRYKRKRLVCNYCGKEMQMVGSIYDD